MYDPEVSAILCLMTAAERAQWEYVLGEQFPSSRPAPAGEWRETGANPAPRLYTPSKAEREAWRARAQVPPRSPARVRAAARQRERRRLRRLRIAA